jgi:S-adenosylmethionine:tRNA ribosyltransferase-isomerase
LETSEFDYVLPERLIAQQPLAERDQSRLMVVHRRGGEIEHREFRELPELLARGDVLVRNDTRVLPARVVGVRVATGGRWEGLYLRSLEGGRWEMLGTTRGRPAAGERVRTESGFTFVIEGRGADGTWIVRPEEEGGAREILERHGKVPLPPYIRKGLEEAGDRERYQTTFAARDGSVAAPTAGLHFTPSIFAALEERGVGVVDLTLHVGVGTFRPIEAARIEEHRMHAEWAELSAVAAARLNEAREQGGRIVAVGTTTARTLETSIEAGEGRFVEWSGETRMYLQPGHAVRGFAALVTNFHLPRSSLLVLVSAVAGVALIRRAYAEAIKAEYRFYSYGDAMLIVD